MSEGKKICPHCQQAMELAVKSYPMGSVFQLNRFHVDMVPCPVCGTMHPAQEKCVTCALDAAFGGTEAREKLVPKE